MSHLEGRYRELRNDFVVAVEWRISDSTDCGNCAQRQLSKREASTRNLVAEHDRGPDHAVGELHVTRGVESL